jgi:MFS family permease
LFVLLVLYVFILSPVISATLGYPLHLRLGLSVLLITPLGFLMGVPFPGGLAWIRRQVDGDDAVERRWIAWMWAVNGAASVVASILASLVSLSLGFTETFAIGAGIYGLSWMVAVRNWEKR